MKQANAEKHGDDQRQLNKFAGGNLNGNHDNLAYFSRLERRKCSSGNACRPTGQRSPQLGVETFVRQLPAEANNVVDLLGSQSIAFLSTKHAATTFDQGYPASLLGGGHDTNRKQRFKPHVRILTLRPPGR